VIDFDLAMKRIDNRQPSMIYSAWKVEKQKLVEFLLRPGHYAIEIGSFCGGTSRILGLACKSLRKQLICVDPWKGDEGGECYSQYWNNVADLEGTVITLKAASCDALELLPKDIRGNACLVFIDGDHAYPQPLHDMTHYWPLLAAGGVMAIHDIFDVWWHDGIFHAVTEFFKDKPGCCLEAMNYIPTSDESRVARHHNSGLIWAYRDNKPTEMSFFQKLFLFAFHRSC
jgi:hypothetical protein